MYRLLRLRRPWDLEIDAQILSEPPLLYVRLKNAGAVLRHDLTVEVMDDDLKVDGECCHRCRNVTPGARFAWVWPLTECPPEKDGALLDVGFADGGRKTVSVPLSFGEGHAELVPDVPMVVDQYADRTLRYTSGPGGIGVGGGIKMLMYCNKEGWLSTLQTEKPGAPGYVTARCSDERVKPLILVDRHGDGPKGLKVIVTAAKLVEGETIEIDMSRIGGEDPRLWSAPGQHAWLDLPLWILEDPMGLGDGHYVVCRNGHPTLTLLPEKADWLRVTVPSIVSPGEEFVARFAAFDRFHNLATGLDGKVVVRCGKVSRTAQMTGGWGAAEGLAFDSPGLYRLEARHEKEDLVAWSNPVQCVSEVEGGERLFWGDIHVHTSVSDSARTPFWAYAYGREVMDLDFVAITDHDISFGRDTGICGLGDGDMLRSKGGLTRLQWHDVKPLMQFWGEDSWRYICQAADHFHDPGVFVTLKGYEWTIGRTQADGTIPGHRNVYYRDEGPFLSSQDGASNTPEKLWAALEEGEAMTVPHSPGYSLNQTGIDWTHYNERFDRVVEVFSSHGASEFFGNPIPLEEHRTDPHAGYVRRALGMGYHLGIIASTDGHGGIPAWTNPNRWRGKGAMAAVWATELTREGVFDAIWSRRCYGVEGGARIVLRFDINGHGMGSRIESSAELRLKVQALAEDVIREIAIIRDGEEILQYRGSSFAEKLDYVDQEELREERYYYVRVTQADGKRAWSSPIWVRPMVCSGG